jgi:hypothetical protein
MMARAASSVIGCAIASDAAVPNTVAIMMRTSTPIETVLSVCAVFVLLGAAWSMLSRVTIELDYSAVLV